MLTLQVRLLGALAVIAMPTVLTAQRPDSVRTDSLRTVRADTVRPTPVSPTRVLTASRSQFAPPLTPRRAFVYSALLPGLGQTRLDRGSSGALFASVELAALVMLRRVGADLREAKRFRTDTLPTNFTAGGPTLTPLDLVEGRYTSDLIRTRRLHVEDWLAVVAFNHLFAGADAFVAAQLWDVPVQLSAAPTRQGVMLMASVTF
jgi:hypothetical protein